MMMSLFCLASKSLLEEVQANIGSTIPFASEYADDGFSGGAVDEVLKLFQEEPSLAEEYGLRYDFNNCTLYLLAGDGFRGDVSAFQALAVRVDATCNIQIFQAPVVGPRNSWLNGAKIRNRILDAYLKPWRTLIKNTSHFICFRRAWVGPNSIIWAGPLLDISWSPSWTGMTLGIERSLRFF